MDAYKQGTREDVKFETSVGLLNITQLWQLPVDELDRLAVSLDAAVTVKSKSFIRKRTVKDKASKLKFDIVLDILNTKIEEAELLTNQKAKKERDQKILSLIEKKKDADLENLSVEQLENLMK